MIIWRSPSRRRAERGKRLDPGESDRLYRIARVYRAVLQFFDGDEQGIMDEAAMKAYARLSVELISSNKVVKQHWKDCKDYTPRFKSWIDGQVAQLARSGE